MSDFNTGVHILCREDASSSCMVIKSGAIIKEELHNNDELLLMMKTYRPDVLNVTYAHGKGSIATITKLLNDLNNLKSTARIILNPTYDLDDKSYTSIITPFIQFIRNNNNSREFGSKELVLANSIQVLSHEVLANLVSIAEHAKIMISQSSPESQQCEMFIGRLKMVQTRIHEVIEDLEASISYEYSMQ